MEGGEEKLIRHYYYSQQRVPIHLSALTHHFNEGREEQKNWIREITLTPPHMRSGPKWGKNGNIPY